MKRTLRVVALLTVLGLVAGACTKSSTTTTSPGGASSAPQKGGTLRILQNSDFTNTLDPQIEYYNVPFEYFRCCLLRMLYSYNGQDEAHDGTKVFPDLAASEPDVSSDGLTYTVKLKQGLKYAPPLQDVNITAGDFIRAIERGYTVGGPYMGYYDIIEGAKDYSAGKAKTISGLKAVDDYTLQFKLTQEVGDFEYRFALGGGTAPIPPNPSDPSAQFGVATGHDNYGPFLVSSGPYMIRGSEDVDFSLPPDKQKPATGYKTGRALILVRNPSWKDDDLRMAYPDEIDGIIQPGAEGSVQEKAVTNDEADTVFSPGVTPETLQQYDSDPSLQSRIFKNPSFGNYYLSMNLAVPPFDDLAVRKAVNFAVDKEGWRRFSGGEASGTIANHYTPDALLNDLLKDYNYYATPNNAGADSPEGLTSAMNEMKNSKYDTNKDGICDAPECSNVYSIGVVGTQSEAADALIASDLKKIGIVLDMHHLENAAAYNKIFDPKAHVAFTMFSGWIQDYPDAYTFYWFTNYGGNILSQYNTNYALIGATPAQLKQYGYTVTSVPSMDDTINKCAATPAGDARYQCWADADKQLNEQIAAYVPLVISQVVSIVSSCVTNFSYDASNGSQAFDRMAVKPDCGKA
jgi:peptide/nickel transport system substrate-binding protein